ncbi:hypothetical protein [Kitasatospora mediocidica]|uniref:hypothetical protein n=1 Tax=Kitasatospora mediocidica TaxID=58352 RepID=UPI00055AEED6|nr:hypothetical protein [Kitasatospora mediocidica]
MTTEAFDAEDMKKRLQELSKLAAAETDSSGLVTLATELVNRYGDSPLQKELHIILALAWANHDSEQSLSSMQEVFSTAGVGSIEELKGIVTIPDERGLGLVEARAFTPGALPIDELDDDEGDDDAELEMLFDAIILDQFDDGEAVVGKDAP